jgi:TolB protein
MNRRFPANRRAFDPLAAMGGWCRCHRPAAPAVLLVLVGCGGAAPDSAIEGPPASTMEVALLPPPLDWSGYRGARHGGNYMHNYYLPPSPSTTPWAPAWSPDGGAIAVGMSGSIWSIDVETGVATELTRDNRYHSSPTWSADGRWIVYTSDDSGRGVRLEALDVASGQTRVLTDDEWVYADPAFSPDGSRLAYVSTAPAGFFNVYVQPFVAGAFADDAIAVTSDNDFGSNRLYFGPWDMHTQPTWLPSGEELLIVSNRNVALGSGNVVRVPARANGIAGTASVMVEQTLYRSRPDVSPDGMRFILSSTRGAADQFNNLYVQPTTGGEPYKMTFFGHDAFHPRWSPAGDWIAFISNESGLPQLALLETYGGARRTVEITERRWKTPMGRLHVTITDESGDRLPARITLFGSDGKVWAPADAYARIGQRGGFPAFHTDGRFAVELPIGEADMTVMHGFEREPVRIRVAIAEGASRITVRLDRLDGIDGDAANDGPVLDLHDWYSGSTHVHMNYGGNLHNTLENLLFMSAAEDQDVVNELVANKDNRILDHQFFVPGGGAHPLSSPDRVLVVGEEYRPPFYGHVFMIGLIDHLISPFTTGYEGTAIESLYPSNTDMLRKAKAQGATTGYVHPFFGNSDPLRGGLGGGRGFIVDAALGATDAVEWSTGSRAGFFPTYAVWNNGIRVAATGGEDSISNLHWTPLVGAMRTYVHVPGELTLDSWLAGLREGRSFVTNGPLVSVAVNGLGPGDTVELPPAGGTVTVEAVVRSITPLERVWLVQDGVDLIDVPLSEDRRSAHLSQDIEVGESGWIHLRAEGSAAERFPLDAAFAQAFTNPVWLSVGGAPVRDRASAEYALEWIDRLEEMALEWPDWRSAAEIAHVTGQFAEAREIYRRLRDEASN